MLTPILRIPGDVWQLENSLSSVWEYSFTSDVYFSVYAGILDAGILDRIFGRQLEPLSND